VGLLNRVEPAGEILRRIECEAELRLQALARLLHEPRSGGRSRARVFSSAEEGAAAEEAGAEEAQPLAVAGPTAAPRVAAAWACSCLAARKKTSRRR
jgi:hypothetical protein